MRNSLVLIIYTLNLFFLEKPVEAAPHRTAVLQGLDKVTARVSKLSIAIGDTVRFGTLDIAVRHCDKRPPEEAPESSAFLDIWQSRPGETSVSLFRGWMFASSPALSALEHSVYDVWVLDCEDGFGGIHNAPNTR